MLKTKTHFYSFKKCDSNYKVIEDLKFDIFILNEREFDVFISSLFDFMKSEKNDVVLLTPICFVDKNSFIKGFKGAFVHNEHS